jgi:hypothetical protein
MATTEIHPSIFWGLPDILYSSKGHTALDLRWYEAGIDQSSRVEAFQWRSSTLE